MVEQATTCCQAENVTEMIQAWSPAKVGTAAHACTGSAVLPATTGAITPEDTTPPYPYITPRIPVVLIEQ
jgi:hypothetical protein